jgi:hypothetical protein
MTRVTSVTGHHGYLDSVDMKRATGDLGDWLYQARLRFLLDALGPSGVHAWTMPCNLLPSFLPIPVYPGAIPASFYLRVYLIYLISSPSGIANRFVRPPSNQHHDQHRL